MKNKRIKKEISEIPKGELEHLVFVLINQIKSFDKRNIAPCVIVRDICKGRLVISKKPSAEQNALHEMNFGDMD